MKRSISDLLDHYPEASVDLHGSTPLSPARIKELTMRKLTQAQGGDGTRRLKRSFSRGLLVAAVIGALCCLTAFAVVFTLWDAARADMGVSQDNPIQEWTEYDTPLQTGTQTESQATLVATMCSGDRLCAYIAVSPVSQEAGAVLAENTPEYEWGPRGGFDGCTALNLEQTSYDPDTRTSLVKVSMTLENPELKQVEVSMDLNHNFSPIASYGPVTVPVTESQALTCPAELKVVNTARQMEEAWGLRPDMPEFSDYTQEGTIDQISICAGYIELEMKTPTLEEWTAASGAEVLLELEKQSDTPLPAWREGFLARGMYSGSWSISLEQALEDATLNYKNGTSEQISQIPGIYAGTWIEQDDLYPNAQWEGTHIYRFTPAQAFDLSQVESITIGGRTCSFPQWSDAFG